MKICYFGSYDQDYIRNKVILNGLRKNNIEVIECNIGFNALGGAILSRLATSFLNYLKLIKLFKKNKAGIDLVIVGSSEASRPLVLIAKFLTAKPLVWDAHYSLYDAKIFDRKLASPSSLKAGYYWFVDWLGCKIADKILLDTNNHIDYFVKTFHIPKNKFIKVLVGVDNLMFFPREKISNQKFIVEFHGNYIPLQGTEYIIRAAKILDYDNGILFRMIGGGQEYKKVIKLFNELKIKNIEFVNRVPYNEIPVNLQKSDICLGIFGATDKTQRVIPNKIYEAVAMARPVITADTPAIRELFTDQKNILLCRVAAPESLAKKILELKNNENLRNKIAKGGYKVFNKYCTPEVIGKKLLEEIR